MGEHGIFRCLHIILIGPLVTLVSCRDNIRTADGACQYPFSTVCGYPAEEQPPEELLELLGRHNHVSASATGSNIYSSLKKGTESMPPSVLHDAPELSPGSHVCMFYTSSAHLQQLTASYIYAGLQAQELCVWITTNPFTPALALTALSGLGCDVEHHLRSGQLLVSAHSDWYLHDGRFEVQRSLEKWSDLVRAAGEQGFVALRATGDPAWLSSAAERRTFLQFEHDATRLIDGQPFMALCTYPTSGCSSTDMFDVMAAHHAALVPSSRGWKRITTGS
jgi:MEDS: MEthanogen/methylotroph, DcmR Sensory domain